MNNKSRTDLADIYLNTSSGNLVDRSPNNADYIVKKDGDVVYDSNNGNVLYQNQQQDSSLILQPPIMKRRPDTAIVGGP